MTLMQVRHSLQGMLHCAYVILQMLDRRPGKSTEELPVKATIPLLCRSSDCGTMSCASFAQVPIWILIIGGTGIVVGLATYGYKIMRVLGVKSVKVTNARGFCLEISTAITVVIASRIGAASSNLCNDNHERLKWPPPALPDEQANALERFMPRAAGQVSLFCRP